MSGFYVLNTFPIFPTFPKEKVEKIKLIRFDPKRVIQRHIIASLPNFMGGIPY